MDVDRLISSIRNAHPDMETIFMEGSCYELFEILRTVVPDAEPWYSWACGGHVYTKIGPWFYDIRGRHRRLPENSYRMDRDGRWPGDRPHRWSKRTHHRIGRAICEMSRAG